MTRAIQAPFSRNPAAIRPRGRPRITIHPGAPEGGHKPAINRHKLSMGIEFHADPALPRSYRAGRRGNHHPGYHARPVRAPAMPGQMRQVAPYPDALAEVVSKAAYRPGWRFELGDMSRHAGASGLTLTITCQTTDSYSPGREPFTATHYFWVPAESHDFQSWQRWLFDKILLVEQHEAMEFFTVSGTRPYPPGHGGGHDPYHALSP